MYMFKVLCARGPHEDLYASNHIYTVGLESPCLYGLYNKLPENEANRILTEALNVL